MTIRTRRRAAPPRTARRRSPSWLPSLPLLPSLLSFASAAPATPSTSLRSALIVSEMTSGLGFDAPRYPPRADPDAGRPDGLRLAVDGRTTLVARLGKFGPAMLKGTTSPTPTSSHDPSTRRSAPAPFPCASMALVAAVWTFVQKDSRTPHADRRREDALLVRARDPEHERAYVASTRGACRSHSKPRPRARALRAGHARRFAASAAGTGGQRRSRRRRAQPRCTSPAGCRRGLW